MKGRKIGIIAALGGGTAALALLTGMTGARADEMQVNQQLLNTRIDQLAAVGQQPGGGAVFSVDQNPATGAAVTAGSFPRSILIPGTDTSIKISGQIKLAIDYIMSGGNPNASLPSSDQGDNGQIQSIPLHGSGVTTARGNGIFQMSPQESKIGFESRTPTPFGEARTLVQWDFNFGGSNAFITNSADPSSVTSNRVPRLQYAYGTLGGLLAGQATSNFSDPDANGETLDQGGNFGEPGHVRIPQVRWTMPAFWGASFSVAAEAPSTDIGTPAGIFDQTAGVIPTLGTTCPATTALAAAGSAPVTCTTTLFTSGSLPANVAKATAPDFTAAYYFPQPWGHMDFSAVIRPGMDVTDGHFFSKDYIGYGGHFGMDMKPGWMGWVKDDFIIHFEAGNGIGSYINSSNSFALATNYGGAGNYGSFNGAASTTTAAAAQAIHFTTTTELGGEIGYQHWWLDNLRSNINAGMEFHNIPGGLHWVGAGGSSLNNQLMSAHANLIWSPVSFVDVGLEYMWGQRHVVNGQNGQYNALISAFNFRF